MEPGDGRAVSHAAVLAEIAYAKINLALHVRARTADGYHAIETLFAFADAGDRLTLAPADAPRLIVEGRFAAGLASGDNLVERAARFFHATFGTNDKLLFRLDKRLPIASGIGGGSADAAAALRLLCRWHGMVPDDPRVMAIAGALGADVPACLLSRPVRGEGRGDVLTPVALPTGLPLLLVNPGVAVPTGPVFERWDGVDRGALGTGEPWAAALAGRNDLTAPAVALAPVIADVLARLTAAPGMRLARMSGSGATCFALFDAAAARDAADEALAATGWWRMRAALR